MYTDYILDITEGIFIEFIDGEFVIFIKDVWSKEEISFLKSKKGLISFSVVERLNTFTLSIEEGLETSDMQFIQSDYTDVLNTPLLSFKVLIFDENNHLVVERNATSNDIVTSQIKDLLKDSDTSLNDNEVFEIQSIINQKYEPFEIEENAKIFIKF